MSSWSQNTEPGSDEWYKAIEHERKVDEYKLWLSSPDYHFELAEKLAEMEETINRLTGEK